MKQRILVAIPIVLIIALAVFLQGWVLAIFAVALACMCQFEILRAMDGNGMALSKGVSFAFTGAMAALFLLSFQPEQDVYTSMWLNITSIFTIFIIFVLAAFIAAVLSKGHSVDKAINTILSLIYPQLLFVLFYMLILRTGQRVHETPDVNLPFVYNNMLIMLLLVFIPAMFSDTFAYFTGMLLGKKKLCPEISPKKTVAGSIGGVVGGILAAFLIWLIFDFVGRKNGIATWMQPVQNYILLGAVLSVISQFGDLTASMLKRKLEIKDFGKLLPGHGGVVDRLDSILFCIPVVYIFKYVIYWI